MDGWIDGWMDEWMDGWMGISLFFCGLLNRKCIDFFDFLVGVELMREEAVSALMRVRTDIIAG